MNSDQDAVLDIQDSSESFSGFSPVESEEELPDKRRGKKQLKSVVTKPKGKEKKERKTEKKSVTKRKHVEKSVAPQSSQGTFDLNALSQNDIVKLREALGIQPPVVEQGEQVLGSLENLPNLRVELDSADLSDYDRGDRFEDIGNDMNRALFDSSKDEESETPDTWQLPKLKAPQKGKAISQSLANMINMACTSQCDVDNVVEKYKIPENCDRAGPPLVNTEVWKIMDKRVQSQDRGIVDIQNLVNTGITPIVKLAEMLKTQIAENTAAKELISDALIILGQVQYFLSIRRRYLIRPTLKKKYQGLCNISMPITTKLFGDDVSKDIKACDSLTSIGKDQRFTFGRGRGAPRFGRRPVMHQPAFNSYGSSRYQPYPTRGHGRPGRFAGYRIPKKSVPATSTAPNEQN